MKILQQGIKPAPVIPPWVEMEITCPCGCRMELEEGDKVEVWKLNGNDAVFLNCPTCNRYIGDQIPWTP